MVGFFCVTVFFLWERKRKGGEEEKRRRGRGERKILLSKLAKII